MPPRPSVVSGYWSFAAKSINYIHYHLIYRLTGAFTDSARFQATSILIATWSNVPKWRGSQNRRERSYEKNTYQVAIISNADETYVEYLYPQGGIQWIQAETGESGLPDIRARAGFILTDGRIVELRGSGTDKVRHLSETSNYGKPGRWLYRVGKLDQDSVSQVNSLLRLLSIWVISYYLLLGAKY